MKKIICAIAIAFACNAFAGNAVGTTTTVVISPEPQPPVSNYPCYTGQSSSSGGCCISYNVICGNSTIIVGTLCNNWCLLLQSLNGQLPTIKDPAHVKMDWNISVIQYGDGLTPEQKVILYNTLKQTCTFTLQSDQTITTEAGYTIIIKAGVYNVVNAQLLQQYYTTTN